MKVLKPGPLAATDPLSDPVVVQIRDAGLGVTPELYINSKPTSWNRFADDLKNELKLRPKWVVYVQADPILPWADIANAIDVAKVSAKSASTNSAPLPRRFLRFTKLPFARTRAQSRQAHECACGFN